MDSIPLADVVAAGGSVSAEEIGRHKVATAWSKLSTLSADVIEKASEMSIFPEKGALIEETLCKLCKSTRAQLFEHKGSDFIAKLNTINADEDAEGIAEKLSSFVKSQELTPGTLALRPIFYQHVSEWLLALHTYCTALLNSAGVEVVCSKHILVEKNTRINVTGAGSTEVNGQYTYLRTQERFLSHSGKYSIVFDENWQLVSTALDEFGCLYTAKPLRQQCAQQLLPCTGWTVCVDDNRLGSEPPPTVHVFQDEESEPKHSAPDHWCNVSCVQAVIQKPDGTCLELDLTPHASVDDVKQEIFTLWGIPPYEQTLVSGTRKCLNSDVVWELIEQLAADPPSFPRQGRDEQGSELPGLSLGVSCLNLTCIRTCPIHFHPGLAHQNLCISGDGLTISHGGQVEYQGAFASAVLEASAKLTVQFEITGSSHEVSGSDAYFEGPVGFVDIYIGLACDADRNWSMMEVTGIGLEGILYDAIFGAIDEPGGILPIMGISQYFSRDVEKRILVLSLDIAAGLLEFRTQAGELLAELHGNFASEQVCLCAVLGYPGQRVHIAQVES